MNRLYKILCVWMVVAMVVMGLAPVVSAQGPNSVVGEASVPPRPDLMAQLQMAPADRPGFALDAALSAEQAETAYREYLAQKVNPKLSGDTVRAQKAGASLQVAEPSDKVLVALSEFSGMTHNSIPKPSTQNNTDYWVENFNLTHYRTMVFDRTAGNKTLANYFAEASYNVFNMTGDIHDWTALPRTESEYGNDATGGVDNNRTDGYDLSEFVMHSADTLGAWTPNGGWATYADGTLIANFVIVHAGKGQEAGGGALGDSAIWSKRGSLATPYQIGSTGYYVKDFIVVSEDAPVGVLVHEMGHQFGLPDTWNPTTWVDNAWPRLDTGGVGEPSPSFWDPMANGCWLGRPLGTRPASMTAWERIQLGWLSPSVWDLTMMPASVYLAQLETPSPSDKALRIDLPTQNLVSPHSGLWMRQAPPAITPLLPAESILMHTLLVNPAASTASFNYWQWYDLEQGYDYGLFEIDAGAGYSTVLTVTGGSNGWITGTVDLSAYVGQTINVRFRLQRDETIEGVGWFLDDFSLVENGAVTWSDDVETSALGPGQGAPTLGYFWSETLFERVGAYELAHYYLAEWRNDEAGFDVGLQEAYNMTNIVNGKAEYFRYNPGLLIWYVNEAYNRGDNNVTGHPGAGFLLAIDAHPNPLWQAYNGDPWRTRVQMQDATFRHSAPTYLNTLTDGGGVPNTIGPLPATTYFWDKWASFPYWKPGAPDNSAKTQQYGVRLDIEGENPDKTGATIYFSIDAGDMRTSRKLVDLTSAVPGDTLQYTIVLTNTGIADAHTIVVSDIVPAYTDYIPGTVAVTGSPSYLLTEYPDSFYWQGTVMLTGPVTITFQVEVEDVVPNGTRIRNLAHVLEGNVPEVDLWSPETVISSEPCLTASTKQSNPAAALAGDPVTYTITLRNTGNSDATVMITDAIPVCTTYVSGTLTYTSGSGSYDAQTNSIYWNGLVLAGEEAAPVVITFQVQIRPGQGGCQILTNIAMVNDGYHQPFAISANTSILNGPNMRDSAKTVDRDLAAPGTRLNYTVVVRNTGNRSTSATATDAVPADTTYVPGSLSFVGGGVVNWAGSTWTWTGTLAPNTAATITFGTVITAPLADGTFIINTAMIQDGSTPIYRSATTEVLSKPRFTHSTKHVTNNAVGYGGTLTYTITLLNDGTQNATANLTDTIPADTAYRPDSLSWTPGAGSGSFDAGNNRVLWSGPVAMGNSITVTFAVSITMTGTGVITNTALVNDNVSSIITLTALSYVSGLQVGIPAQTVYCGDLVTVPIRVQNVVDLQGFQVSVTFDPTILKVDAILEGSWFSPAAWVIKSYNNISGTSLVAATLILQPVGKSGSGDLYYLRFRAIGTGTSAITFITDPTRADATRLSNTPLPSFTAIPFNPINGSITVAGRSVTGRAYLQGRSDHSGATLMNGSQVLGTTGADGSYAFCPPAGLGQSFTLRIVNRGYLYAEKLVTVNVTGTLNLNDVTLLGGDPIGSQMAISTTTPCSPTMSVVIAGAPDGRVNVLDLTFVGARFGRTTSSSDWGIDVCHPDWVSYKADINADGRVDVFDLVLVGNNFGRTAPVPWP